VRIDTVYTVLTLGVRVAAFALLVAHHVSMRLRGQNLAVLFSRIAPLLRIEAKSGVTKDRRFM